MTDSIGKDVEVHRLCRPNYHVSGHAISGATVEEAETFARVFASRPQKPDAMIIHVGTNDLYPKPGSDNTSKPALSEKGVADKIDGMMIRLGNDFPGTKFIMSKLTVREDHGKEGNTKVKNVNSYLTKLKHPQIDNSEIAATHLNGSKLHLHKGGTAKLVQNFSKYLSSIY